MSLISAQHITKSYGGIRALEDISLSVERQEIVILLGPDGAGKTSLMRILCHLIESDPVVEAGRTAAIQIGGFDIVRDFDRVQPLIGYMPQSFSLYTDLSVEENMTFYAGVFGVTGENYRRQRDRMYEFSNLGPFANRRAGALSGGMKQKLALSCALLHDPRILILDEPTTGVDPLSRRQFWRMLRELRDDGVTILAATPYMDEVALADRVVCMFDGRILTEAPPKELATSYRGSLFDVEIDPTTEIVQLLNELEGIQARRFGSGLRLSAPENIQEGAVEKLLAEIDVRPRRIDAVPPDIEDRFIQLIEENR